MSSHHITIDKLQKPFDISILLPGSKSITLRDLVLAALAEGESSMHFPGICDDTARMEDALRRMGIRIYKPDPMRFKIEGRNGQFSINEIDLDVGESGTSARLLLALSCLRQGLTRIDGQASMRARPNQYLLEALSQLGAVVESTNKGYLPASIRGAKKYARLVKIRGNQSSQFVTALLLIAPLLPEGLELVVEGELVSKPYIEITLQEMKKFGVDVKNDQYRRFIVRPQPYQATELTIEGDASAASYFSALATLHGGSVTFTNLGVSTKQGDAAFFSICQTVGAQICTDKNQIRISGPKNGQLLPLKGPIDMESMPDVAPTLMAMAPFIPGVTRITGLSTLRIKECDRIASPVKELRKFGVKIEEGDDFVEIDQLQDLHLNKTIEMDTYQDHRMAMSFAVFASRLGDVKILNPACVEKTYPQFWQDFFRATKESCQ